MQAAGVDEDRLAGAVVREGLKASEAPKAVRNWLMERSTPRCTPTDIRAMAGLLGCEAKDLARFTSSVRHHRGSAKKATLLIDLVRGKQVDHAIDMLTFSTQRAAVDVRKAIQAARAEAEQNDADLSRLVVAESRVDKGMNIKRFQPKDRGRAHQILKRTSHILVSVEERA
jgi:large subunit ribosomal protein L22